MTREPSGGMRCAAVQVLGWKLWQETHLASSLLQTPQKISGCQLTANSWQLRRSKGGFQSEMVVYPSYLGSMLKLRALRVKNALVRECMAEFLGTFVLLVSELDFFKVIFFKKTYGG